MAATGLDGQNMLIPLGMMVCRFETITNLTLFLSDLDLNIACHPPQLTFISDIHKGLHEDVPTVFPEVEYIYCWRHLYANFKKAYKGQSLHNVLWNASKAYKQKYFWQHMNIIRSESEASFNYLMKENPQSWARSFFSNRSCCEHLNNNFSESFNSMIRPLRDEPICKIRMMYCQLLIGKFYKRRIESAQWRDGDLVSSAVKLIGKILKLVGQFNTEEVVLGYWYQVTNVTTNIVFNVNLLSQTCSCQQWQLRKFSCQHGVCALKTIIPTWSEYCSPYYSVDSYIYTYAPNFRQLDDVDDWPEKDETDIKGDMEPPIGRRKTGKSRVKRRRAYDEPKTQPKTYICTGCKSMGHNKATCRGGDVGCNPKGKRPRTYVGKSSQQGADKEWKSQSPFIQQNGTQSSSGDGSMQ